MKIAFVLPEVPVRHRHLEMEAVPRVGDFVALTDGEWSSATQRFMVDAVWWTPDTTEYEASVFLRYFEVSG